MFRILSTYGTCISFYSRAQFVTVRTIHTIRSASWHENIPTLNEVQFTDSIQIFTDDPSHYGCIGQPFFSLGK